MSADQDDKLDQILASLDKIQRGLYGDADNKVPGLMQDHHEVKEDVKLLKEDKKKQKWIIAGVSITIPIIIHYLKEKFGI